MLQCHLKPGAQEVAPKGFPGDGDLRMRKDPLLPWLTLPELRAVSPQDGAGGSRGSRGPGVEAPWWPAPRHGLPDILVHQATDPGVDVGSPALRLPALPTVVQRVAQNPAVLSSLLLPPVLSAGAPRGPSASRRPTPRKKEDHRRGLAREAPRAFGALLREFLPNRFREFLCHLCSKSDEQPPKQQSEAWPGDYRVGQGGDAASSASQHQVRVSKHCRDSPQCPNFSFLPDLRGQPSFFREPPLSTQSLKILLHQTPDLGSLKSDCSQVTTVRKTNREGPRPRKRCCPFRVRFADETLRDTALRYWERSCAIRQSLLESETASQPFVSEQVFRSVSRWLESLPRTLCPGARQEKATASSSWSWDCPGLPTQEPLGHLFENTSMSSGLPCIHRASTQSQWGHLKTHLDAHNILEQVGKLPCSWSQKLESFLPNLGLQSVLKRGRPKGYQLLPSKTPPQAQR
ncbi:uncharacterized protein C9orf50 homolog [Dugong dugon]